MTRIPTTRLAYALALGATCAVLHPARLPAQQPGDAVIIQRIDAVVHKRFEVVTGFADREHYAVFRGQDRSDPIAEMTVEVTYRKGAGKSYKILSASGSALVRKFGLIPLLEREKAINNPATVQRSWFTSANYDMKVKPGGTLQVNGSACIALAITPRHKATNMIKGTLWVDAKDYSIARVEGVASKRPSIWAGATRMIRDYRKVDGFAMATHARAESNAFLVGRIVVAIDYSDYRIQVQRPR